MKFSGIHLYSGQAKVLADFYRQVLQVEPAMAWEEGAFFELPGFMMEVNPHAEVHGKNQMPARMFFDFAVEDVDQEFERVKALGAQVIKEPYDFDADGTSVRIATLADPDGNYFQLMKW